MTNEEKFDEILGETNEFFKKKLIEAYGLDNKKTIISDISSCSYISNLYDALDCFCYFDKESENCKHCTGYGICKILEEIDCSEWNKLEYKRPVKYTGEMETTTAISKDGISW